MEIKYNGFQFDEMEQRYRASFFNSLGGFKSLTLLGTSDVEHHTNLSVVSSVFHIGANPPLMGLIFRPDSVSRHSLENIMATRFYTFNHVNEIFYQQAHQTSARYPREISEFEACGFTVQKSELIPAPYVLESRVKIGLQLQQRIDLEINGTVLIIGKIIEVFFPENCLSSDGFIDIEKAGTITVSGLDSYHSTQKLKRLPYAKP
jgi:flavin reductase (DIM6/NTAB) family NADH-FMN oxidoreductase RutF